MADVQIDNVVRAQCVWKGKSGLPEDHFVTTWHFVRDEALTGDAETQADEVAERLREFWLENNAAGGAVVNYLSSHLGPGGLEIRCYDLGQPPGSTNGVVPPRVPRIYTFDTIGFMPSSTHLPEECAITLSFYASQNVPRRRGRVFIGPLSGDVMETQADSPRVDDGCRRVIVRAAQRLALERGAGDRMQLGVLSQADGAIRPVTAGWCDNAFDTIRKRGQKPSSRETFPVVEP